MLFIKVMDISLDISCDPTTKNKGELYLAQSNFNQLSDPKKCPHPSRLLIDLRIRMGILFIILVMKFTCIHVSYGILILK